MDYREEIKELLGSSDYTPMTEEELVRFFQLQGKEIGTFIACLDEMYESGEIFKTKRDKYVLSGTLGMVTGTLQKHKKGFGFVVPLQQENGTGSCGGDIYVAQENMRSAMHGDVVIVKLLKGEGAYTRREGAVARILHRAHEEMVGTFYRRGTYGFLVPDDPKLTEDVFVDGQQCGDAQTGDKVVVTVRRWPEDGRRAEGAVTEIISRRGEPGGDVKALIRQYGKKKEFPEAVQAETAAIEGALPCKTKAQWEAEGRRDLREDLVITIDGADSKDFDDAVGLRRTEQGEFLLSVHIADVTHYVKEGRPLDQEALARGTSIYLLDQVIPMLPKELSNGICSLNPGEDRLALSVDMCIDGQGRVKSHEIYPSVIRSKERMVYTDVSDLLDFWREERDGEEAERTAEEKERLAELCRRYAHLKDMLLDMEELAGCLRRRREEQGSIDFDLDEAHITLDEAGVPVSIGIAERRIANRIIEDFMVTANETVAEHFYWMGIPFVYRVHDKPEADRIGELKRFLGRFGLTLKGSADSIHPRAVNELLAEVQGMEEEAVIHTVTLRAMQKAVYSPECLGHFGLGLHYYCHFTSPIRRYPDLMIHRIIKEVLAGDLTEERTQRLERLAVEAAEQSSRMECQAQEMEREADKMKMAEYMEQHVGDVYEGIISGVTGFGFFVQLETTIEGLVRTADLLDDYYEFQPEQYRLVGSHSHRMYCLGDRVKIRVTRADAASREIDFAVEKEPRDRDDARRGSGRQYGEKERLHYNRRGKKGDRHENKAFRRRKFRK